MNVFVPTPTPKAHSLLEVAALRKGYSMRTLDIVAAFLIGTGRGAQQGKPVYIRAPPEWWDIFVEWSDQLPKAERELYKTRFRDVWFRLDGNLYGRRTAGSVYRDELEEVLGKLRPHFEFKRLTPLSSPLSLRALFLLCKGFLVSWCQERAKHGRSLCTCCCPGCCSHAAPLGAHSCSASRTSTPAAGRRARTLQLGALLGAAHVGAAA